MTSFMIGFAVGGIVIWRGAEFIGGVRGALKAGKSFGKSLKAGLKAALGMEPSA